MRTADLLVGTINVHTVSDPDVVRAWLEGSYLKHEPDLVALQELTGGHIRAFRQIDGYDVRVDRSAPGSGDTGWLVRRTFDHEVSSMSATRMTKDGWWGWQVQRQHTPRFMAQLDLWIQDAVVSFGSVHTPPGVDVTPDGLTGPRDRRRAWKQYMRSLLRWNRRFAENRFVLIGDWNERAHRKGKWSPNWLAKKVGAIAWGAFSIDYPMVRGMKVTKSLTFKTPDGLDHNPRLYWMDFA